MTARWLELGILTALACGCHAPPQPADVAQATPAAPASAPTSSASRAPNEPPDASPRLIIESSEATAIDLREFLLVDEAGERGTQWLWPDPYDCPKQAQKKLSVPGRGSLWLAVPTRSFSGDGCTPSTPLPAGRYVVRVSSGYDSIYAAGTLDLPLSAPVRLQLSNHHDEAPKCDPLKAQRAARLGFAAVKQLPGLPAGFLQGCDAAEAVCGALPLTEAPPPAKCTVTLHEDLLVVAQPAGDDQLRGFRVWTDAPVSYVQRPQVSRSSASRVSIDGKQLVIEGTDERHIHTHGGDAARIGGMQLRAHNPLTRGVAYEVKAVEWLTTSDCGLPSSASARPKLQGAARGTLAPGQSEIDISFAVQHAYQAYCDRFASRVVLGVEGQSMAVAVEHQVTRIEPLRR